MEGKTYTVEVFEVANSLRGVTLYGFTRGRVPLAPTDVCNGSGNVCARIHFTATETNVYFARVQSTDPTATGSFRIRVLNRWDEGLTHDADGEPNDASELAEPIGIGADAALAREVGGRDPAAVTVAGDQDYFHFFGSAGYTYIVELFDVSGELGGVSLGAFTETGDPVADTVGCQGIDAVCARIQFPVGVDGEYVLRVRGVSGSATGSYRIRVLPSPTYLPGAFVAVTPARVLDTRIGLGADRTAVPAGGSVALQVAGVAGIPLAGASAVVVTVTVTATARPGHITVYPGGSVEPVVSNLNFVPGQTIPDLVMVPIGVDGQVQLANHSTGTVQLIADVAGYYVSGAAAAAGAFVALAPQRLLDTRIGWGADKGAVPAGGSVGLLVAGAGGVPGAAASAVVLTVTATSAARSGHLTVHPDVGSEPEVSNLNFAAGQTVPNLVVVPLGNNGRVQLVNHSTGTVHLIADVAGYFVAGTPTQPGMFVPVVPERLLDTRTGAEVGANGSIAVRIAGRGPVPTAGAGVVLMNLTVTAPTRPGNVTAFGDGSVQPATSNVNFVAGQTIPDLAAIPLGANGSVRLANGSPGTVHLIADIAGYFLAAH